MAKGGSKASNEKSDSTAKRKRADEEEQADESDVVPALREVSRQEYLKKREGQKLRDLRDAIEDEERMFKDEKLTASEKKELENKKQVYELAREQMRGDDALKEGRYVMPGGTGEGDKEAGMSGDRRYEEALKRYTESDGKEEDDSNPFKAQEAWESHQIGKALEASRGGKGEEDKQYDLLQGSAVEFVKAQMMNGEEGEEDDEELEAIRRRDEKKEEHRAQIENDKQSLPIYGYKDELVEAINENQILIIVGETGSGKTTQIPQYLHEQKYTEGGAVAVTQPRRVAAMSVAARVADEMNVKIGHEVGYAIRFEDCTSEDTFIKFLTDGMLLRELLAEAELGTYQCLMVDEAHERTLHTDVLFGLVKDIARYRPDLKLLVSSATLDAEKFSDFFDDAPIFRIPGRRFPVEIFHSKAPEADYLDAAVVTTLQVHAKEEAGDILVFLTGQEEIESAEMMLKERTKGFGSRIGELVICPVYANLPSELQAKIFEETPEGARKVVLATNIAETSVTIGGIRYVVDPGFSKQKTFNPKNGIESLVVTPISKASAMQRAGRAGRTEAGKCFRLFTLWSFEKELEESTTPEIQRSNLGNVVLLLKSMGVNDLLGFDFLDPPPAETLQKALEMLYALGALTNGGELTKLGRRMAEFPTDPMLSKMLLASERFGVSEEIVTIASMLSASGSIFYRPKEKKLLADSARRNFNRDGVGDHLALLNVYNEWAMSDYSRQWCFDNFVQERALRRCRDVREQLGKLMQRSEVDLVSNPTDVDGIRRAVTAGFFSNAACLHKSGVYKTAKNAQTVSIHPSSSLSESAPKWVVYFELVFTSKEFMRTVTEIDPKWLNELAPHFYSHSELLSAKQGEAKMPKGAGKAQQQQIQKA